MYLRRRLRVQQEGARRNTFLRYLGEVATAVNSINNVDQAMLYEQLVKLAKRRTSEADLKLDDRGRPVELQELESDTNVLIVDPADATHHINRTSVDAPAVEDAEEEITTETRRIRAKKSNDRVSRKGAKAQKKTKTTTTRRSRRN
jgi:DNA topoisomerase-6 subunit B